MKRLVQIADEVDQELERGRTVSLVEGRIGHARLMVLDPIHDAVAPSIVASACGHAGLPWAITIAVVSSRALAKVDVVPRARLRVVGDLLIGPDGNVGETRIGQQPRNVLPGC